MKRFYKTVLVAEYNDGYCIMLDGRPVKTKSGQELSTSIKAVAERVATEWDAQGDDIIPDTMPFTQILNTKIDRVSVQRKDMTVILLKYLDTDLICYPCAEPQELHDLQEQHWQPWRAWCREKYGADLMVTSGLAAVKQSDILHENIASYVHTLDDDRFTILQIIAGACGSLVLALAFVDQRAAIQDVYDAAFVEEHYKDALYDAEKYGADPLIQKKKAQIRGDLESAFAYLGFL